MTNGICKWYNTKKGYGFITPEDGSKEIFVHSSGITKLTETEIPSLNEGDKVTFDIQEGQKGPEAHNVVITEKAPPKERTSRPRPAYGSGAPRGYPSGDNEESGSGGGGYRGGSGGGYSGGGGGGYRGGGGGGYSGGGGGRSFGDRGGSSGGGGGFSGGGRGGRDQKGRSSGRKRR
jgi:cold shock CspA family protein